MPGPYLQLMNGSAQTSQFSKFMDSYILEPLPYSPLK